MTGGCTAIGRLEWVGLLHKAGQHDMAKPAVMVWCGWFTHKTSDSVDSPPVDNNDNGQPSGSSKWFQVRCLMGGVGITMSNTTQTN